jgi:DNA (cytosine-5)-methyltransferase 1
MTDESLIVNVEDLIRICYAWPFMGFKADDLPAWLSLSPDHFFIKFQFPTLAPKSWTEKKFLGPLKLCEMCSTAKVKWWKLMTEFLAEKKQHPMRILDLFAGSGAFGLAMEETGCIKVTHAVEISPSAAETFRWVPFICFTYSTVG